MHLILLNSLEAEDAYHFDDVLRTQQEWKHGTVSDWLCDAMSIL